MEIIENSLSVVNTAQPPLTSEPSNPTSPIRPPKLKQRCDPPKRRGEAAELVFMLRAIDEGFAIAKPWGDSERYDFILDNGSRLWRVQVRSTATPGQFGFSVRADMKVNRHMVILTSQQIDVIAAYIVPYDLWYLVPVEEVVRKILFFGPHESTRHNRWEKFRDAWDLLR